MHSPEISTGEQANEAEAFAALSRKARFWNQTAHKYAGHPIADMDGYERTLRRVQTLLSEKHEVLEIGCGTGTTALQLAPGTRRLVATDVSEQMIAIARAKLASQPMQQLQFRLADAEALAADESAYDVVLAFNVLHLMTDLSQALDSTINSLKPGGLLISKTPCLNEMPPLIPKLVLPLMRAIGKAPPVLCFNAAQLQAAMSKHGLDILSVERHGSTRKDIRAFIVARKQPS